MTITRSVPSNDEGLKRELEHYTPKQRDLLRADLELTVQYRRINARLVEGRNKRQKKKDQKHLQEVDTRLQASEKKLEEAGISLDVLRRYRQVVSRVLPLLYFLNHEAPPELIQEELNRLIPSGH